MKKKLIGFLMLAALLLAFNSTTTTHAVDSSSKTIPDVLDSAWDQFGLYVYSVEESDSIISIGMDETKSKEKLKEYLEKNLPEEAKIKYNIKIFKGNIVELEKEHKKSLEEQ